jgi:hypothetical protein
MPDDYFAILSAISAILGFAFTFPKFKSFWGAPEVLRNPFTYYIMFVNLLFTSALPLQLLLEFGISEHNNFKPFSFYCSHYPQLVIYPSFFFGFAALFVTRTAMIRWNHSPKAVQVRVLAAALAAIFAVHYEATGDYLMLLEFNKEAQSATKQFESQSARKEAHKLGISQAFIRPLSIQLTEALAARDGKSEIAAALRSFSPWNRFSQSWKSKSRISYLIMFGYMIFTMILGFSLIPTPRLYNRSGRNPVNTDSLVTLNLAGAFLVFLMWIPFRIYYNHTVKIPLFGRKLGDNFLGTSLDFDIAGLTSSDILPMLTILVFLFFLVLRAGDVAKKAAIRIVAMCGVMITLGSAFLAKFKPDTFAVVYGLEGNPRFIIFRVAAFFLVLLLTYDFLSSRIDNADNNL